MTYKSGLLFFVILLSLLMVSVILLQQILAPFITAALLAYMLMPLKIKLSSYMPPTVSVILLVIAVIIIFMMMILVLIPALATSLYQLSLFIPDIYYQISIWVDIMRQHENFKIFFDQHHELLHDIPLDNIGAYISNYGKNIAQSMVSGFQNIFSLISFICLVPIILFYSLCDGDKFSDHAIAWFPKRYQEFTRKIIHDVLDSLKFFLRGQINVCLLLVLYYIIALWLVDFTYAVVIGLITGAIAFIPILGALIGGLLTISIAMIDNGSLSHIFLVITVFMVGQFLESYILTPKFIGERLGLHALVVMFALLAGTALAGITGAILALPFAAMLTVLYRVFLRYYQQSHWYLS